MSNTTNPAPIDPRRIALIGFGEVGQRFGKEFLAAGQFDVATYDILFNNSPEGTALREAARALRVEACASAAAAIKGTRIVFSCVIANAAKDVADEAVAAAELKAFTDKQWRDVLDKVIARIKAKSQP
jgi:3-hydroxyisobutyrate dehydrogenase-like beta-hydroxyacid dehydrogenase